MAGTSGMASERTGGQLVVEALEAQGVTRISCVPGESYLPVLDALIDSGIELDVCRHEAGAGNMAVAAGKLTGRAGVVAVTRGPGAMHAAIAVHTAQQDALPMVLLIGQVALRDRGRGGFQEMEYARVFGSTAKWVTSLDVVERIPETIARAFRVAEGGRPGPVVIEMPEDVLAEVAAARIPGRVEPMRAAPAPADIEALQGMIARAERPIALLGRSAWSQEAADAAREFAERYALPLAAGFRCQDYIDNDAEVYVGHVGLGTDATLVARLEEADLILSVGGHFGDAETKGYEILAPRDGRAVAHVSNAEGDVDRYLQADLVVQATPLEFFRAMNAAAPEQGGTKRTEWMRALREEEAHRSTPNAEGDLLSQAMAVLQRECGPDTIVANGAGNYAIWVHQFTKYRRYGAQLAPASGAMGFGLPAGIAAGLHRPEQPVIVFAGDGCFSMSLTELATLAESRANVLVIVVNNGMYGTIRMHQERRFPGRVSGTALVNPDFVGIALACGIPAERVEDVEAFERAFAQAQRGEGPSLIEIATDPDRSTPGLRLSELSAG
ncbi:MAG: thiamine pyrophosphate-dependent enzyme [Leucobacter sp.]